jgi:hypothetical protein
MTKQTEEGRALSITSRIKPPFSEQLRQEAKAAKISCNELARRYIVAGLEKPSYQSLLFNISTLTEEVGYLRLQVQLLTGQMEGLRRALYLTAGLLLVLLGDLSPEEASRVIEELLTEEEEKTP